MMSVCEVASPPVGSKGATLVQLQQAGFCVPAFVCNPTDLAAAVELLGFPLVVRSSASAEDGCDVSFAGQFESFLKLSTLEEVEDAVQRCHKSLHGPSVAAYCRRQGIAAERVQMGIIVQRMVEPELAGVAFTINPVTGAEEVAIEATLGLAHDLLAGRTPALPPDHPILLQHIAEITRVAREIQRCFGMPQDIEFAVQEGTLFILQARPITRISFAPAVGEWTNADFRDGGVSCRVCTPLMWSLYDSVWEGTLKGFLADIKLLDRDFVAGRMFFGRPYWNFGEVKRCLSRLPGFSERDFERDLGVDNASAEPGLTTPVTIRGLCRALPTVLAVGKVWKQQAQFDRAFLKQGFADLIRTYDDWAIDPQQSLRRLITHAYQITESNYFRTIFCASLAKLDFMEAFPDADYAALVSGLPALTHLAPTRALQEMAVRKETDVTAFLKRFAHRSRRELDIREPRWDEDRAWVEKLLEQSPTAEVERSTAPAFEELRRDVLQSLPWHQRRRFTRKLDRLRTFLWLREEMRDLSSRMYHLLRKHVLAVAVERGLGDDVFFMSHQEILRNDRSNIARNRECYESYRNFRAPTEIGGRFRFEDAAAEGALKGVGASRGKTRGVARVAHCIEEAADLERGAILVCAFTDPGWTPVLARVGGVVTETGGLLSHAAVICREYGIPAVLGVLDATRRIPDGSTIAVDGGAGYVEVLA